MKTAVPGLVDSGDAGGEDEEPERELAALQNKRNSTRDGMNYQDSRERAQRNLTTGKAERILSFTTSGGVMSRGLSRGSTEKVPGTGGDCLDRRFAQWLFFGIG